MKAMIKALTAAFRLENWENQTRLFWGGFETLLGALPLGSFRDYVEKEKIWLMEAGSDRSFARSPYPVRLLGYWNEAQGKACGTVLIMHGWEASSHGADTLAVGSHLNQLGFHTMRLNFRDHGNSHAYNEGVFNGSLIEEVSRAAIQVAGVYSELPFFIIGPSLGGNFAIRVAYRDNTTSIPNLEAVVAVCPAMDPYAASLAIDRQTLFRHYFCLAWKASLAFKARIFRKSLDFDRVRSLSSIVEITKALSEQCFGYDDLAAYYDSYTITPARIRNPKCQIHIISSRNDPIITIDQFEHFSNITGISLDISDYGGHVGYSSLFPPRNLLPWRIAMTLRKHFTLERRQT